MSKEKNKQIAEILVTVVLMLLLGKLVLPLIQQPSFLEFIKNAGILGPIVIIFYVVLSHVIIPITGSPMLFLSVGVFGLLQSQIYFFTGGLFSSAINFWIARKYGRRWVMRLAGKNSMRDIDSFVSAEGDKILLLCRLFGFPLFDFISYAVGLTSMKFKKYYLISNAANLFVHVLVYFVYKNLDFQSERGIYIWVISLMSFSIIFTFWMRAYMAKRQPEKMN